jgi:T5SS/PEP-CTERM-associated repeat protein
MQAGSIWNSLGLLEIGDGGSGEVNITLGGKVNDADAIIGADISGSGEVTVDGMNSLWDNSGTLTVGGLGAGTLNITNRGVVESSDGFVGNANILTSNGTVNVSGFGSKWNNSLELAVGSAGGGALNVTDGAAVTSGLAYVGRDASGTGNVTVDGINSKWTNSHLIAGRFGEGTLNITDGGNVISESLAFSAVGLEADSTGHVSVNGASSFWGISTGVYIGHTGSGTLEIKAGGRVVTSLSEVGRSAGGAGHVLVDGPGSLLDVLANLTVGLNGDGTLEITGGGLAKSGFFGSEIHRVGDQVGGTGHVSVDGIGSQWQTTELWVGVDGDATLDITNGGVVSTRDRAIVARNANSTATVTIAGDGSQWRIHSATGSAQLNIDGMDGDSGGRGTLRIQPGGVVNVEGDTNIAAHGRLVLEGGEFTSHLIDFVGTTSLSTLNFSWTSGALHVELFDGDLVNQAGALAPGKSTGPISFTGIFANYNQLADATMEIEVGGTLQSTGFDYVQVSGSTFLGGNLELALVNGFLPSFDDEFIILSNVLGGLFNTFANVANGRRLATSDGLGSFVVNYGPASAFNPKQIVLSDFLAGLLGDFVHDGDVDGQDFLIWQRGGSPNPLSAGDLADWKANYGLGPLSVTATVPEPGSWMLVTYATVVLCGRQRTIARKSRTRDRSRIESGDPGAR